MPTTQNPIAHFKDLIRLSPGIPWWSVEAKIINIEVIKRCLDCEIDPNSQFGDEMGWGEWSLLAYTVYNYTRDYFDYCRRLLAAGALANQTFPSGRYEGWSLIHYAAYKNIPDLLELLLAHGASPNGRFVDGWRRGWTPLVWAVYEKNVPVTRLLLQARADADCYFTQMKCSLLHYAVLKQKSPDMVRLLLEFGANPDKKDRSWHTLLVEVMLEQGRDNPMALLLIEFGANPDQLITHGEWKGWSVLAYAMFTCQVDLAKALLAKGANPHHKISSGIWQNISLLDYVSLDPVPPVSWLLKGSKEVRDELRRATLGTLEGRARQREIREEQTASSYQVALEQNSRLIEQLQQRNQELQSELIAQHSTPAAIPLRQPGVHSLFARSSLRQRRESANQADLLSQDQIQP